MITTDNRLFKSEADVKHWVMGRRNVPSELDEGILIDSKLRREILIGENSGRITLNGHVREFKFENLRGGVWKLSLPEHLKQ